MKRSEPWWLAPARAVAVSRVLKFPSKFSQLWSLQLRDRYFRSLDRPDRLFFLSHEHYLSRYLTLAQRVDCAIAHYRFERQHHTAAYHHAVYHSSRGLTLWERVVGEARFSIILRATEDNRHEGDLSILCCVDGVRICRISFAFMNAGMVGLSSLTTLFVTRNQTDNNAARRLFTNAFRQNAPQYFCLAAVCGIALASGMRSILLIKAEAQIAYAEKYSTSFANSYSTLWQSLGAADPGDRHAFLMPVPMPLTPLSSVNHKTRAIARRGHWLEITQGAHQTLVAHQLSRLPDPALNPSPAPA